MTDYRNLPIPLADGGLDIINPRDKIVPGKWASLLNVYPQKANIITQRKGFTEFFDQGDNAGSITQIFSLESPNTPDIAFFATSANGGTIGVTDSNVPSFHALSLGWGNYPVFIGANPALNGGQSAFIPLGPVPAPLPFTATTQSYIYTSSSEKLRKFAYPPIFSTGSLFSELIWGLAGPLDIPSVALLGSAGGQDSSVSGAEPYTYCYTFFSNLTGAESVPSPVSAEIDSTLQAIQINFLGYTGPFDIQYDALRVYRKGGTQVSTFRLVATISAASITYTDTAADDSISTSVALFEDNFRPFVTQNQSGETLYGTPLPYIWGPFLGQYIFACGDEVQPGNVFWTNTGRPDTSSPDNNLAVTSPHEPLVNGFIYGANSFVFSQQRLFALDYGGPTSIPTFVSREIPINMGLAAPFALTVSSLGGVFFLGNDGIYVTDCQSQIESITNDSLRPIFRGEYSGDFPPVNLSRDEKDIRLFASGQELHFIYPFGSSDVPNVIDRFHLVYNILQKSWRQFKLGITDHVVSVGDPVLGSESSFLVGTVLFNVSGIITDPRTLILKYNNNNEASPLNDAGSNFNVTATTGGFDLEIPQTLKEFGNIIVDADPNGGIISVTPIRGDGTSATTQTLTGTGRVRYPLSLGDEYDYFQSYNFTWDSSTNAALYNIEILFRADQEVLKHWEIPETAFGMPGWNHIRDGYFVIRSTSDVALTITIDGTPYSYTIPSTGGEKRKVYMKFRPIRGKMFRFALDALPNTLNDGLVSFWDLEEFTGALRLDAIGTNNLTSFNNVAQVLGKIDFGAGFTTASVTHLTSADATQLNPGTGDWSMSLWMYPTNTPGNVNYWIIGKGATGAGVFVPGYNIYYTGDGTLNPNRIVVAAGVQGGSSIGFIMAWNPIIPQNTWSHFAVTLDRDGDASAYLNGTKMSVFYPPSLSASMLAIQGGNVDTTAPFTLGTYSQVGPSFGNGFTGNLDAVGWWSRVLTQTEVSQLYNQGAGLQAPLNPTADFRLYGDETQLNIKAWNTNLGYKPIFPFGAPGYAPFLRNEAGT